MTPTWRTLSLHPRYLESFLAAHQFVLRGGGPIQEAERNYIAMMVSE